MLNFFQSFLDLLYPRFCYACQERVKEIGSIYLCPRCMGKVTLIGEKVCPICGRPGYVELCPYCFEERPPFKMARSAGLYEGILKEGIHRLKYNGHTFLVPTLGKFLQSAFERESEWAENIDMVIPVPLERNRERQRGFNQSALLAQYLAQNVSLLYPGRVLLKLKKTAPQVNLTRGDRFVNLSGAFSLNPRKGDTPYPRISLSAKRILLVDDVYTTGATVGECSRVLLKAGAKEVNIFTLARGT